MAEAKCQLEVRAFDLPVECDGCRRLVPAGERMLCGIESCCGATGAVGEMCKRALCCDCVKAAAQMVEDDNDAAEWARDHG